MLSQIDYLLKNKLLNINVNLNRNMEFVNYARKSIHGFEQKTQRTRQIIE